MRVLFEPGWEGFKFKSPRLLGVRLAEGRTISKRGPLAYDRWLDTSGPILDFDNEWMALRVPLPEGESALEGTTFEIALRLVLAWREIRIELSEGGEAQSIEEDGLKYTIDRYMLDQGNEFSARLRVGRLRPPGSLIARLFRGAGAPLELDDQEFRLEDEHGKSAGWVHARMRSTSQEHSETTLSGFLQTSRGKTAKGRRILVVRRPGEVADGKLVFELGPLAF